jgi:hypothetical protein
MKTIKYIMGAAVLLTLSACVATNNAAVGKGSSAKSQNRAPLNTNFYQHWVNAYEEQGGNATLNIFRPVGSQDFSHGGFRMELDFKPDGTCRYKDANSGNMWRCVYTKIGKKVYMYNHQGGLLGDLIFTLVEEPRADKMRLTYGILSAIKKEKPVTKAK